VHFGIEAVWWYITVKETLRGVNEMLGIGFLPCQLSHAFDDVSTPVFDKALVIVVPSQILESVFFPFPKSLIIWHARHDRLDAIPIFEACETRSCVFFLQHLVIVRFHAILLDPRVYIFVLFPHRKREVGIASKFFSWQP
jgi:hypothetical protein